MLDVAETHAEKENLFVLQLGDLVDRGPESALAVEYMRNLVDEGRGAFLIGNHEHRLALLAQTGRSGAAPRMQTLFDLNAYGEGLLTWYLDYIASGPIWAQCGPHLFAHAAFHPHMLRAAEHRDDNALRHRAMFGLKVKRPDARRPQRVTDWVDQVPRGHVIYVGHHVVSRRAPARVDGKARGAAWFLDTGGWDGGVWSTRTLWFASDGALIDDQTT